MPDSHPTNTAATGLDPRAARHERIVELAKDIEDMGHRVAANGGEPTYASEKLGRALTQTVRAIATIAHVDLAELLYDLSEEFRRERDGWQTTTCPTCSGFRALTLDGQPASSDQPATDTTACTSCDARGAVQAELDPL